MPIRLNAFKMPEGVEKEESSATSTFGRYTAGPFEIGYARTIGNSLRRVLLSSIEGCAISSVKITGAPHEFCALPGVREDVTEIVLALKKVLVKTDSDEPVKILIKQPGPCIVTAADLAAAGNVEILNPDHRICTVDESGTFEMEVTVSRGRGFCPAAWDPDPENPDAPGKQTQIGVIPIDRIYSPVVRVNFDVENTRVGQQTDYERLVLEISTDGRVDPDDALVHAADILRRHLDVFVNYNADLVEREEEAPKPAPPVAATDDLVAKLKLSVNEIELSVRAANCLNNANISTVGELCQKLENDMLKYRNFGKKSLGEIKDKLKQMGLSFGMKFDENVLSQLQ
ncbi:MAG: DNA-directed RNA polymerase subunit alpha [Kiritimatiellae bacterium]|nr:DNA-directed RNA polymerase subunit alpha [Kiritimatiellia bacterium]